MRPNKEFRQVSSNNGLLWTLADAAEKRRDKSIMKKKERKRNQVRRNEA